MSRLKVIFIYSGSIFFFLFLAPGTVLLTGRLLDRQLHWPPFPWRGLAYLVGIILMLVGLSCIKASWQILLRVGKGHPQEVFGYPLFYQLSEWSSAALTPTPGIPWGSAFS